MNKVSQLNEEKAVILNVNSESIKNLTNQITQLNLQLNEYKKKEFNENKGNLIINSKNNININTKTNINTISTNSNSNIFDNDINIIKKENDKKDVLIFEKDNSNSNYREKSKDKDDINKKNIASNEKKENEKQNKREEGFLTRFLAPIFLTENERNNLSKN
jgi:hypothetical protein